MARTLVGLVVDGSEEASVAINALEGSQRDLPGLGKIKIKKLLQFQIINHSIMKGAAQIFFLVEYEKIKDEPKSA